jgi:ribosomal protein S27AE
VRSIRIKGRARERKATSAERVAALVESDPRLFRASDLVTTASRACPRHGPGAIVEVPLRHIEGFSRFACGRCRLKLGIGPSTPDGVCRWAEGFVLGFGMYRGSALSELAATPNGRSYLGWLATREGDAAMAARVLLERLEVDRR